MTEAQQLTQLQDLRKLKVDQMMRAAQKASQHVGFCQDQLQQRIAGHAAIAAECNIPFDQRFLEATDIADPQARLVAVNATVLRLRRQAAAALNARNLAQEDLATALDALAKINRDILRAQGRLTGVDTLLSHAARKQAIFDEAQADEEALDQFSGRRAGGSL